MYQISSESDNFCDCYRATHRQIKVQTPKTFRVQSRASLTFRQLTRNAYNYNNRYKKLDIISRQEIKCAVEEMILEIVTFITA